METKIKLFFLLIFVPLFAAAQNSPKEIFEKGVKCLENQDFENALKLFKKYSSQKPADANGHFRQGIAFWKIEENDSALICFNQALRLDSNHRECLFQRASLYLEMGENEFSHYDIDRVLSMDSKNAEAYFVRGQIHRNVKGYDEAISDFSTSLKLNPKLYKNLIRRAEVYILNSQPQLAAEDVTAYLSIDSSSVEPYFILASAHYYTKNYEKSISISEIGTKKFSTNEKIWEINGLSHFEKKNYSQSIESFNKAISLKPEHKMFYQEKIRSLVFQNTKENLFRLDSTGFIFTEIKTANFEKLAKSVKDKKNSYYFETLLEKFQKSFDKMGLDEYFMLYFGYSFQKNFSPYKLRNDLTELEIKENFERQNYDLCLKNCKKFLEKQPFALDGFLYAAVSAFHLQNYKEYEEYFTKYSMFLNAIAATGNGKNFDNAFIVSCVDDEYNLTDYFGLRVEGQSLVSKEKRNFDVLKVTGDSKINFDLYFNIDCFFGKY